VKVLTDDDQFRQELLAIPGFAFWPVGWPGVHPKGHC
jgi:hypothetical protein